MFPVCQGGAIAVLDPDKFRAIYPAFSTLTNAQVEQAFAIASMYLRNDGSSPVRNTDQQTALMYMLTAHVAALTYGEGGQAPSGLVGRVSSASEGSVSVSTEYPTTPDNAWFLQTSYGSNFWQATAAYRTFRPRIGPQRFQPVGFGATTGGFRGIGRGRF